MMKNVTEPANGSRLNYAALVIAALLIAACKHPDSGAAPDPPVLYTAGSYMGTGYSIGGAITVRTDFSVYAITAVEITGHNDTVSRPAIVRALETFPAAIVEAQSAEIDAVSGATYTCRAIRTAVEECVEQAAFEGMGILSCNGSKRRKG